ncbi:hypothetical protein LCGC14_2745220 [marine sediment metagenome]|uniref:Cupin type-2 domain-containing protein n=1 Tax=marine sediment metagenome TaxID=412755 RepID=A0A0F9BC60_9ZZZZ
MASCQKFTPTTTYHGKQGFDYLEGVSRESSGAQAICMHLLTIPPGGRATAHKHATHETAVYLISGRTVMYWGDRLEHRLDARAGDLVYIPADTPHLPLNPGPEPAVAVISRTDPHEQESVELLPNLDPLVP